MGIITKKGNLLDAKGIIVHGCNCQGVMGSGVALAIKNKWPDAYAMYKQKWATMGIMEGDIITVAVAPGVFVVNALTQEFYGRTKGHRYVSYDAVQEAFAKIQPFAWDLGLPVNFPLIGAGLGGGDWEIISTIIDRTLGDGIEKILWVQ